MKLHGIHHITAITADAPGNLRFYAEVLGLRFVKKTVNFDDPTAYHLYYGDERGSPGSILTFFEYPGIPAGRAGRGMIHRIAWGVAGIETLDFWQRRLNDAGIESERGETWLRFTDPEGLQLELSARQSTERPLRASAPGIPARHVLQGFAGVRAFASEPGRSIPVLEEALGFDSADPEEGAIAAVRAAGGGRSALYVYDQAPAGHPVQGAGTVHHIAWAVPDQEQADWRDRVLRYGLPATQVIDRTYFRSVYFREPSGVLFELATLGPGFTIDEPLERLGEGLRLPPQHEPLRQRLERELTPLTNPRRHVAA